MTPATLVPRIALFAALAGFAGLHASGLLAARAGGLSGPDERVLLAVAVASAGGFILARSASIELSRPGALAARLGIVVALALGCLLAVGVPPRLLTPDGLAVLADGLERGVEGIRTLRWPYAGADRWVELAVLVPVALAVAVAAALSLWPGRRHGELLRGAGAAVLVATLAVAVVEHDPGQGLVRGLLLLGLLAAWAWLPRARVRELGPAALASLAAAALALPLAAGLDPERPWLEYRTWAAGASVTSFDWDHRYGPIDWPRTGATLLHVRAPRSHYWKVETLDAFDGQRWRRSGAPAGPAGRYELPEDPDPRWFERIGVTIRSLRSDLAVGAGTTLGVTGAGPTVRSADGTIRLTGDRLEEGDAYTAAAYVPDPTVERMRAAPRAYPREMVVYTALALPLGAGDADAPATRPAGAGRFVTTGLRGAPGGLDRDVVASIADSPYAGVQRLAADLVPSGATDYEAVKAVERHLRTRYAYSERPPPRRHPLAAFLLEDRRGYCQQFSGAMALMLRMRGIPARVAAGFAPGSRDPVTGEHAVRDLDAHSWVEVWFAGIGWVPFDPTPAAAPAGAQSATDAAPSAARGASPETGGDGGSSPDSDGGFTGAEGPTPDAPPSEERWGPGIAPLIGVALAVLLTATITAARLTRRARRLRAAEPDPDLRAVEALLGRLEPPAAPGATLAALARRFESEDRPRAAQYLRRLSDRRFAAAVPARPTRAERRAVRREARTGRPWWRRPGASPIGAGRG